MRLFLKRSAAAALSALALGAVVGSPCATAQTRDEPICTTDGSVAPDHLVIAGCTSVIQSGQITQTELFLTFVTRGNAYQRQRDYARAVADYDQAIRLEPQSMITFFWRGYAYSMQGDQARAIADYDQAIRLNPQYARAFRYRGQAYENQHDYARAISDYGEWIRIAPQDADAFNFRCWARATWGQQLDQALADCDTSLRLRANDPGTLDSRALVHLRRSEWQAALTDYDAAVRGNANLIGSVYGRGIARLRLGQTAEGQADIAAASARDANVASEFAGYGIAP